MKDSDIYSTYPRTAEILKNHSLPLAYLDLDLLDKNIESIKKKAKGVKIRIATKSVRCFKVVEYIRQQLGGQYAGVMCYHPNEALFYLERGFSNPLVAYPYFEMDQYLSKSRSEEIIYMADSLEHIEQLESLGRKYQKSIKVCLDIDLSDQLPFIYFGVHRSSLRSSKDLKERILKIKKCQSIKLVALMGYEAQIAGVGDKNPFKKVINPVIRLLKNYSKRKVLKKRTEMRNICKEEDISLTFFNGGGTGSLDFTSRDKSVDEIAVGSGFYTPLLFDYYQNLTLMPAAGFILEVTRSPSKNYITCAGGGYIASGSMGGDKFPRPIFPTGLSLVKEEMTGEVQTPLYTRYLSTEGQQFIKTKKVVFFRHAKAGELCEHFNSLAVIRRDKLIGHWPTYRGEGLCFLG